MKRILSSGADRKERIFTTARILGTVVLVGGYFIMLHVNLIVGLTAKIIAASLMAPWLIKHKIWDVVTLQSIMGAMDLHKLISLILL